MFVLEVHKTDKLILDFGKKIILLKILKLLF